MAVELNPRLWPWIVPVLRESVNPDDYDVPGLLPVERMSYERDPALPCQLCRKPGEWPYCERCDPL